MTKLSRRPLALLSLAAVLAAGLSLVKNSDLGLSSNVGDELVRAGIEGEGDIPLPAIGDAEHC